MSNEPEFAPNTPDDWQMPKWRTHDRVHCWRNYINPELQAIWGTFSDQQKILIAKNAQKIADAEEWD